MTTTDYDTEELGVMGRMKAYLIEHGWERADFVDMTFLDVEAEYFGAGGVEFRGVA
jgi:hypothetical protein